jgi:3-hydroxyacyl-[acyl-carrier-protein] dehydratase
MEPSEIMALLPYSEPFLFVDGLTAVSEEGCEGHYTYSADADFYRGHFKGYPVTPGVILTETMAQIGLVCLGIYLIRKQIMDPSELKLAFTSSSVDFLLPVLPGEKVKVSSRKEYFRFNKLKCHVEMRNASEELVCRGILSGMIGYGR